MSKVDVEYFKNKLQLIIRDLHFYKSDELARELGRLAKTADENALYKDLNKKHGLSIENHDV